MKFQIGWLTLGGEDDGPDPGPQSDEWKKTNIVEVKQIPGKGKRFITIRTSDKVLWVCTLTVRSISNTRYMALKLLCEMGGPYQVVCHHGMHKMYIADFEASHDENDKEAPLKIDDGSDFLNVATWTITLQEANDGGSEGGSDTGVTGNLGSDQNLVDIASV